MYIHFGLDQSSTKTHLGCVSTFMNVGQDQAWHRAHGPSMCLPQQRSSSLLAIAHVSIPSPNFILGILQQTKRIWVTGESTSELLRLKAWLGCVAPDPVDNTLPRVKALFQSRMDLRLTKRFFIEVLIIQQASIT